MASLFKKRLLRISVLMAPLLVVGVSFQNCARVQFADSPSVKSASTASCSFNGQSLVEGQSVTAYLTSAVDPGSSCSSEMRTCSSGALSGSYNYATCSVGVAASCLFNGQTIAHGQTVTGYYSSSAAYGSSCLPQARTCNNGVLSGSYTYASCSVGAAASCLFNGQTIAHGQSVTAFATSTAAYGSSCSSQVRSCDNGTLSGSYAYASCAASTAQSCLFNGQTVADGQSVPAYTTSLVDGSVDNCAYHVEMRTCSNGFLSGSAPYSTCKRTYTQWNTNRAVFSPCGGPSSPVCSSANVGATVIGDYCGSGADAVWTCTQYAL